VHLPKLDGINHIRAQQVKLSLFFVLNALQQVNYWVRGVFLS